MFFVLGAPGSGKTVVCTALADRFGCTVLSVSDLMRSAIQDGGTQGTAIKNMISSGQVVPTKHTLDLVVDLLHAQGLVTRLDAALSAQQVYTAASEAFETSVGSS